MNNKTKLIFKRFLLVFILSLTALILRLKWYGEFGIGDPLSWEEIFNDLIKYIKMAFFVSFGFIFLNEVFNLRIF